MNPNIFEVDNSRCLIIKKIEFNSKKFSKKDCIARVFVDINIFQASNLCLIAIKLREKTEFNRVSSKQTKFHS